MSVTGSITLKCKLYSKQDVMQTVEVAEWTEGSDRFVQCTRNPEPGKRLRSTKRLNEQDDDSWIYATKHLPATRFEGKSAFKEITMDARFTGNLSSIQYLLLGVEAVMEISSRPRDETRTVEMISGRPHQATFMCVEKLSDDDSMHFRRVGLATAKNVSIGFPMDGKRP
jgi:hypothetical protein